MVEEEAMPNIASAFSDNLLNSEWAALKMRSAVYHGSRG